MKLKYHQHTIVSGIISKESTEKYTIQIKNTRFVLKGSIHNDLSGQMVTITGIPIYGVDTENEFIIIELKKI